MDKESTVTEEQYDMLRDQLCDDLGVDPDMEWIDALLRTLINNGWTHPDVTLVDYD